MMRRKSSHFDEGSSFCPIFACDQDGRSWARRFASPAPAVPAPTGRAVDRFGRCRASEQLDGQCGRLMHEKFPHALENVVAHGLVPEEDPDARQRGEVGLD